MSDSSRYWIDRCVVLQINRTHILCTNLSSVFDFFSLDVEGAEMSVLESIDFERTAFGVILVEADEHNEMKNLAMRQFLELRGYTFLCELT